MADQTKPDPGTPMPAQEIALDPAIFKKLPVGAPPTSGSGVAGTVPGTSGGYSNPQINEFIGQLLNTQEAQRTNALNQLGNLFTLRAAGFPINPNAFKKYVNQSHLKGLVPTDPAQLQDFFTAQQQQTQGQTPFARAEQQDPRAAGMFGMQPGALPRNPFQQNRDGTITAQPGLPEHVQEAVSLHNDLATGNIDPKTVGARTRSMYVKSIAHAATQAVKGVADFAKTWGQTQVAIQKAELEHARSLQDIETKKRFILDNPGSPLAAQYMGALMSMGGMEFNVTQLAYANSTPEQKQRAWDIATGGMSPADRARAVDGMRDTVLANGILTDPGDAQRYSEAVMNHQPIPDDIKAKIQPSLARTLKGFAVYQAMLEAGASSDQARDVADKVSSGASIKDSIPTGIQSAVGRELDIRSSQYQSQAMLEAARIDAQWAKDRVDQQRADTADKREAARQRFEAATAFKTAVEAAQKSPTEENLQYLQGVIDAYAPILGMTAEVEKSWTYWLPFFPGHAGKRVQLKPIPSQGGLGKAFPDQPAATSPAGGTPPAATPPATTATPTPPAAPTPPQPPGLIERGMEAIGPALGRFLHPGSRGRSELSEEQERERKAGLPEDVVTGKPGALERFKREHPAEYKKAMDRLGTL